MVVDTFDQMNLCSDVLIRSVILRTGGSSHLIIEYQKKYLVSCYPPRYLRFKGKKLNYNSKTF